jgi:hypothetical protein
MHHHLEKVRLFYPRTSAGPFLEHHTTIMCHVKQYQKFGFYSIHLHQEGSFLEI